MKRRFCYCDAFFIYKIFKKSIQNEAETIKKTSKKTTSFLTSFFSHFDLRFGTVLEDILASRTPLGRSWAPLGRLLGVPWALLGVSWALLGLLGASWAHLGRILGDLGVDFEGFQGWFGRVWGEIRTSK